MLRSRRLIAIIICCRNKLKSETLSATVSVVVPRALGMPSAMLRPSVIDPPETGAPPAVMGKKIGKPVPLMELIAADTGLGDGSGGNEVAEELYCGPLFSNIAPRALHVELIHSVFSLISPFASLSLLSSLLQHLLPPPHQPRTSDSYLSLGKSSTSHSSMGFSSCKDEWLKNATVIITMRMVPILQSTFECEPSWC